MFGSMITLSEDELLQVRECGRTITVSRDNISILKGLPEDISAKVSQMFEDWIRTRLYTLEDSNGCLVEFNAPTCDVTKAELEARETFTEVFKIYQRALSDGDRVDITGLYLTFVRSLGAELNVIEAESFSQDQKGESNYLSSVSNIESKSNSTLVVFDKKTAQLQVTHKNYSGALLPSKNKYAYIINLDKQLQWLWDENGQLQGVETVDESTDNKVYDDLLKRKDIPANCADTDLLGTLFSAVNSAYINNIGDRITVNLPSFARAMSVQFEKYGSEDTEKQAHFDLWSKIKELESIGGVLVEQGKILRAFVFLGYDKNENTLTFASPYLYELMDILQNKKITSKTRKNNKPTYQITGVSYLIDAKIITARNKITAQIVKYLNAAIIQRGVKTDASREPQKVFKDKKLITKSVTYRELIKDIPLLKEALQQTETRRRSRVLRRVIFGEDYEQAVTDKKTGKKTVKKTALVEDYLREYTDAFNYWKDLSIEVEPVSMKELDNKITFRHHGIDGEFQERLHIPHVENGADLFGED